MKLEVLGDPVTLLPDPIGTLEATEQLVKEGFTVMVYCSDDPRMESASPSWARRRSCLRAR